MTLRLRAKVLLHVCMTLFTEHQRRHIMTYNTVKMVLTIETIFSSKAVLLYSRSDCCLSDRNRIFILRYLHLYSYGVNDRNIFIVTQ